MTPEQQQAVDDVRAVEAARPGALEVLRVDEGNTDVFLTFTLDCRGIEHDPGGIRVRARERFIVAIPRGFPFDYPHLLSAHKRWIGTPHVQWGKSICLYLSVEAEWNPSDGILGFLDRLRKWLAAAAKGELDPQGAPVHPPTVYNTAGKPMFIPRVDTPKVGDSPWIGLATLEAHGDRRYDITGWKALADITDEDLVTPPFAAAILLPRAMPLEFPEHLAPLLEEFLKADVPLRSLVRLLWLFSRFSDGEHLPVVVGTPMRGIRGDEPLQHLAVWRIEAEDVESFALAIPDESDTAETAKVRARLRELMVKWSSTAKVDWCPVREARPEVTRPRDEGSPVQWWKGKTVEVWGCGALGGKVAEHLCRADVGRLVLRDNSKVAPGVLGRQNFEDDDIGDGKAHALAARLKRILPNLDVIAEWTNLTVSPGADTDWSNRADVVFDVTAAPAVSKRLEMLRARQRTSASLVGMMIGYQARNGLVTTARPDATGGTADAVRKAKITAARKPALREYANEFWPDPPRTDPFLPEPGCSSPTFTGSDAEVNALASTMFLAATEQLARGRTDMTATFVSLPAAHTPGRTVTLAFEPDFVLDDAFGGYQVRFAASATAEMQAWVRRSERLAPGSETGGVLFGERDDALQVLWISDVLGPPPDSKASPEGFVCGTEGVDEAAAVISKRSRDASRPVGMWHTHPGRDPVPSPTDFEGMAEIIGSTDRSLPKQLLVIVGGNGDRHLTGAYLYDRHKPFPTLATARLRELPATPKPEHRIGLALSGGGFRAVAFHLGVLRALHDRDILEHVEVLSTVSGGSIIGAMWAYSDDDFATFDRNVTDLLRSGLNWKIARALLLSKRTPQIAMSTTVSAVGKTAAMAGTTAQRIGTRLLRHPRSRTAEPLPRQWANRTAAVQDVFERVLGDTPISEPKRGLHVIVNACDLRSGSAFRFGSTESGCARYGRLTDNNVPLALAVAASAAYPVALPALDVRWDFTDRHGSITTERLLITDGGVFDNLGTSCLQPDRNPRYSTNVHPVDYVVSADAGQGVMDANRYPLWWAGRMKRSFESVYRKVQDSGKGLIYRHGDLGKLQGFILPFLGQNDQQLRTIVPPDLVRRDEVVGYPTNFSKMSPDDLKRISLRGEQLTRMMIEAHAPEIA